MERAITMETKKIIVSGLVQGVGFRWATQLVAKDMQINGTVKNLPDGTVEIIAQGDPLQLSSFLSKVKACPTPAGRVDHIKVENYPTSNNFHSFNVVY